MYLIVRCLYFLSFYETNHVYNFCFCISSFGFSPVEIKSVNDFSVNMGFVLIIEFFNHFQTFLAKRMSAKAFPEIIIKSRDIPKHSEHDFCD